LAGVYILENTCTPLCGGGGWQLVSFGRKIIKRGEEIGDKCKRKRRKKERKIRKRENIIFGRG
jgi:hypothetical protein